MSTPVDIRLLLTAYADGALDEPERLRVEAAVAEDPTLAADLAAIREQQQVLALLLPMRPAPEVLDGQRRGRVLAEAVAATWVPAKVPRLRWPWLVAGLAASMVVGLPLLTISIGMTLPMTKVVEGLSGGDVKTAPMRLSVISVPSGTSAPMASALAAAAPRGGRADLSRDAAGRGVDRLNEEHKLLSEQVRTAMMPGLEAVTYPPGWEAEGASTRDGRQSSEGKGTAGETSTATVTPATGKTEQDVRLARVQEELHKSTIPQSELQIHPEGKLPQAWGYDGSHDGKAGGKDSPAVPKESLAAAQQAAQALDGLATNGERTRDDGFETMQRGQEESVSDLVASSIVSFPGPDLAIPEPQNDMTKAKPAYAMAEQAENFEYNAGDNGGMVADTEIGRQTYQFAEQLGVETLNKKSGPMFMTIGGGGGGGPSLNLPFPLALQRPVVLRGNVPLSSYVSNFSRSQVLIDREVPADLAITGSAQPRPAALALVNAARYQHLQVQVQGEALAVTRQVVPQDPTQTFGLTLEDFKKAFGTTPMQDIAVNQQQTFSLDADTASFVGCVAQVAAQQAVDPATVRVEHFVNAVPMDLPEPTGTEAFALYAEGGPSPFAAGRLAERTALVAVGVVGRAADAAERRPLNLVLAVDTSGSMAQPGGLQRLRLGLTELLPHLRTDDKIAVITFADRAVVALPPVSGDATAQVQSTLAALRPDGATNAAEGLALAYQVAGELAAPGRETRVVLATDGATVTGPAATAALARVAGYRSKGITLLVLALGDRGAGAGLGTLADKANGQQVAVTSDAQAQSLFRTTLLPERLQVLARDAKAQVTWNPARVSHARLVGYEERRLEAKDFRNDAVDAGELSQAARATALFEVVLVEGAGGPLGQAAVRYLDTRLNQVVELSCPLPGDLVKAQGSTRLRLAACAAEAGELLQQGWWSNVRGGTWPRLEGELQRLPVSSVQQQLLSLATNMRAHGPQGEP